MSKPEPQPQSLGELDLAYDEHDRLVLRRSVLNPVAHAAFHSGSGLHGLAVTYPLDEQRPNVYVWGPWEPVRELCEHELIYSYSFKPSGLPGMPYATVAVKCRKCGKILGH